MTDWKLIAGMGAALLVGPILLLAPAVAGTGRYDLRPGDHLVFRQEIRRVVESPRARFETLMRFTTHALVTHAGSGSFRVGFQRNRLSAELLRYSEGGRNRIEKERPEFAARVAKTPAAFAEANWFTAEGAALLPSAVIREARSEMLPHVRELPPLPPPSLGPGDRWPSPGALGIVFKAAGSEALAGETCRRFDGSNDEKSLRVGLSFCEESGTLGRLEWEGSYATPPQGVVREIIRIDRVERRRGEDVRAWLLDRETREGVLAAFLASDALPVDAAALTPLLDSEDPVLQRKALAVLYRHRMAAPPVARIDAWLGAADARLRTMAVRVLERAPDAAARPLLERARNDADPFVAAAALSGLRRFEAGPSAGLAQTARAVDAADEPAWPAWACGDARDWPDRALRLQRRLGQPPSATLRVMTTPGFERHAYVMYVPDDYRGDEPFPLLIALGGGAGRAIPTAQGMRESLEARGYLALIPQAGGGWWEKGPTSAVAALVPEVQQLFSVDPNRVFLTGFSNGGTGTLLYATLWPHRLAAAAPLMGGGVLFFGPEQPALVNIAGLPLLLVHGDEDEVIPVRATVDTVKEIRRLNADAPIESHVLAGRGHDIVIGNDDDLTLPFFEGKKRDPFPRRLRFATRSLEFGRDFWVDVLAKDGGMADVQAEIGPDNAIAVTTRRVNRLRLLLRRELLAADAPVVVRWNGREAFHGPFVEDCGLLASTWKKTRDPFLAHSFEVDLDVTRARR